jgi:GAF domain-containing protein
MIEGRAAGESPNLRAIDSRKAAFSKFRCRVRSSITRCDAPIGVDRPAQRERSGHAKSIGEQGISSALCVPIVNQDQTLGSSMPTSSAERVFTRSQEL